MMEAGLCAAWRTPIADVRCMLADGAASEDQIAGALTYSGSAWSALFSDTSGPAKPVTFKQQLQNGNVRETRVAEGPEALSAMAGLDGPPDNLDELLAAGLDEADPLDV